MAAIAGWYPDPELPGQLRWWDGQRWTEHRYQVTSPPAPADYSYAPPGSQPQPRPRRRARILLLAIGIPLVVVLLIGGGSVVAVKFLADPGPALGATPAHIVQPGTVGYQVVTPGGATTTAQDVLADDTAHYANEGMDARCAPLAFGSPVNATSEGSGNSVTYYTNFISQSGGTSISGSVQAFPTSDDENNYLDSVATLLKSCTGDFIDGDGNDHVSPASDDHGDSEKLAWNQVVKTSTRSYTVQTIEWANGDLVARSWCYQITDIGDPADNCGDWAREVEFSLKQSH